MKRNFTKTCLFLFIAICSSTGALAQPPDPGVNPDQVLTSTFDEQKPLVSLIKAAKEQLETEGSQFVVSNPVANRENYEQAAILVYPPVVVVIPKKTSKKN